MRPDLRLFTRLHYPYGLNVRKSALVLAAVVLCVPAPALADGQVGDAASVAAPRTTQSFAFFSARSATAPKAYWNPCSVIRYGIDPSVARTAGMRPRWEVGRWKSVVREASAAMGIRFEYVGRVQSRAAKGRPARIPGADIVITYGTAKRAGTFGYGAALAGSTAGVAGVQWTAGQHADQITNGYVVIDAKEAAAHTTTWQRPVDPRPATERQPDALRALYMHEFAHALGLEHVADSEELMYAQISASRPDTYGPGDRAGLRALGAQPCF